MSMSHLYGRRDEEEDGVEMTEGMRLCGKGEKEREREGWRECPRGELAGLGEVAWRGVAWRGVCVN